MKSLILLFAFLITIQADFIEGRKIFDNKCSSCHGGYIEVDKLKENFFEKDNKLLNLKYPTENMLAYAIIDSPKKIGDPEDKEMREVEIEEYLKGHLKNPDPMFTICDSHIFKYYAKKEPMPELINDEEALNLAIFFMEYKAQREKNTPKKLKVLSSDYDESKIIEEAVNEGKNIIIYATSKSCYFCKKMKEEVLDLDDVQNLINEDYIFIEVDVDNIKLPFELEKEFKNITPTLFFLDRDGDLMKMYPGAWKKNDFIEILSEHSK